MTRLALLSLVLVATVARAQEPIVVESAQLKLVEEVDVPAERAGVLRAILVQEGDVVDKGAPLARIDDEAARIALDKADADRQIARRIAADRTALDIARRKLDAEQQKLIQLTIEHQIASRQAENLLKVQSAEKALGVAENELDRARKARATFENAVSQSEIDGLQLKSEQAGLEVKQSRFEREIDELKSTLAEEIIAGQKLIVEQARLEVARAEAELEVSGLQVTLKEHEQRLAEVDLQRRVVVSPLDGVVVERYHDPGEWIEPGQPVLRVLRLDPLWVEGFIDVADLARCEKGCPVALTVSLDQKQTTTVKGRIVFIGREVDPVNREVLLRAEIQNPDLDLLPGMEGELTILPRPAGPAGNVENSTSP